MAKDPKRSPADELDPDDIPTVVVKAGDYPDASEDDDSGAATQAMTREELQKAVERRTRAAED